MTDYIQIFGTTMSINIILTVFSSEAFSKLRRKLTFRLLDSTSADNDPNKCESQKKHLLNSDLQTEQERSQESKHKRLLFRYLCVYLLATMSDWLQGPFVYALFSKYGFSQSKIAILYVAGSASSMVFGSFVGGMADRGGRRKYVVIYCIIYALSCVTKHVRHFWILIISRLCSGIATSLLFSAFESWIIKAHAVEHLDKSFICKTFSVASYGNSVIAILAGLISYQVSSMNDMKQLGNKKHSLIYLGGFLNPYDLALLALILCGILAQITWEENYGEQQLEIHGKMETNLQTPQFIRNLRNAFITTMRNSDVLICGIISSLFEGSMYVFVFMWTPMLSELIIQDKETKIILPFGLIFSTFMVCCMIGSSLFSIILERIRLEKLGIIVFIIASVSMGVVYMAKSETVCFIALNVFETCVGMYFPIMGTMKSVIVPENQRAAIYNLYRIPLNFIVLMSLLTNLTPKQSFLANAAMIGCAAALQTKLAFSRMIHDPSSKEKLHVEI